MALHCLFYYRRWTQYTHLGGTEGSRRLAKEITEEWRKQGLDQVMSQDYEVLLSYPNWTNPSYVQLLDGNGNQLFISQLTEAILSPDQNQSDVVPPYNAYSAKGDVKVGK